MDLLGCADLDSDEGLRLGLGIWLRLKTRCCQSISLGSEARQ